MPATPRVSAAHANRWTAALLRVGRSVVGACGRFSTGCGSRHRTVGFSARRALVVGSSLYLAARKRPTTPRRHEIVLARATSTAVPVGLHLYGDENVAQLCRFPGHRSARSACTLTRGRLMVCSLLRRRRRRNGAAGCAMAVTDLHEELRLAAGAVSGDKSFGSRSLVRGRRRPASRRRRWPALPHCRGSTPTVRARKNRRGGMSVEDPPGKAGDFDGPGSPCHWKAADQHRSPRSLIHHRHGH